MFTIPLISNDRDHTDKISASLNREQPGAYEMVPLADTEEAVEYLSIEMPDLAFINFDDPEMNGFGLLDTIMADPWLLHSGIIALYQHQETYRRLEKVQGANLVVSLTTEDLERYLPRIMAIIRDNRRILFQREIGSDIVDSISGAFRLNNDPLEASCYANLLCNFLFNANKLDPKKKGHLNTALNELLLNAIEHGNCGINYEEKSAWMEANFNIAPLIEQRCENPAVARKKVTFEYTISPTLSKFFIADEGKGFDWRKVKDPLKQENILELHGRGILITRMFTQNLTYNEKGNEVSFEIAYEPGEGNLTPGLFHQIEPLDTKPGEIIFREGEPSNFLYYIVKGVYDVTVGGKTVSRLSSDDVFMGEMSFLLNNRRSASVQASTEGRLIRISKKQFVEAIKKKPHYALFLSRLLAQRIQRLNIKSSQRDQ
jgi:anti-sigma regulatory factor (Ser/Thr protein kinase)